MENKGFLQDNIPADLDKSWHIPRPTLARSSNASTSSNNSTQSARSGSLLLTAANLAQIENEDATPEDESMKSNNLKYYLQQTDGRIMVMDKNKLEQDNVSVASSMHFTVVNVNSSKKQPQRGFCRKHQLTILVLTMSALFTIGILTAILLLEMRAKSQRY